MFRFSLQIALDVRARQEKMKMKDLAEKLAVEQHITNQIDKIREDTQAAETGMNQAKQARIFTIRQLKSLSGFKGRMKHTLALRMKELAVAKKAVMEKQEALIEASRSKKTLEILKEKEEKRYLEKISTIERKNMDEIAGNQFAQKLRH
ncbi:flagellar export protein FliJ [bacterium]|nr:flagellar export protein FliJ [bacterium]